MNLSRLVILVVLLFVSNWAFAQPGVAPVETIEGTQFYMHTVEKGQTIYGIARLYKTKQDLILKYNPDAISGLKPGDKLRIPVANAPKEVTSTKVDTPKKEIDSSKTHTVQKGETLYGISKLYGITTEQLINLNPQAAQGINIGDQLILPTTVTKADDKKNTIEPFKNGVEVNAIDVKDGDRVLVEHVVKKNETLFSLSQLYKCSVDTIRSFNGGLESGLKLNQVLIVPITKALAEEKGLKWYPDLTALSDDKKRLELLRKEVYEVGLFLPFYLDKNQQIWDNQNSTNKIELYEPTRQSLDFYHGVLVAIDSLKKYGLSVNLHVFDTYRDSSRLKKLVNDPEFEKLDLIIGPTDKLEYVASAAQAKNIPMVCPFNYSNKILLDNSLVAKAVTSNSVMISETCTYIAQKFKNENIILIDGKGKKDEAAVGVYRKLLNAELKSQGVKDTVCFVRAESYASKAWQDKLRKDKINVLVVPSNDYGYVSSFFNNLNGVSLKYNYKDYQFVVVGTDDWLKYDDIDFSTKMKFKLIVPSPIHVDYQDTTRVVPFIKSYRNRFNTDPDKYGLMGFDIAYFFLSGYLTEGKQFADNLENYDIEGVHTRFKFKRINPTSGYLNSHVYILQYIDYRLMIQN